MRNRLCWTVAALLLAFTLQDAWAADTMLRCGNELIERGDTMFKVRQACGPPRSEQRVGERTSYTILPNELLKIKDSIYIEEWVYEKDAGLYILTFEGSRLVKKEYSR
jgi:hypothetical protein